MHWPKSAGEGVEAYVADAVSRLDRVRFERDIKEYIGPSLASKLRPTHFQVLFEISDDYVRRHAAVSRMKSKNTFLKDCKTRTKLMATTRKWLVDFQKGLDPQTVNEGKPVTALLARSVSEKISKLQRVLEKEFDAVEEHQRLSKSMLRQLSLKHMRASYVARLNFYIENVALSKLADKQKVANTEKLIAGVMSAAGAFTAAEKTEGLQECVHMARWRAKVFLKKKFYDQGEFPMLQTKPKAKTSL